MKSTDLVQPMAVQTAIAINGDKTIPNQTASSIDTSSIETGFLPITSQPLSSGGQAPERTDFNGMFYLSTDQRVFLQNGGVITYSADVVSAIGGYPQNAILGYIDNSGNFGFVKSLIDDNAYNFVETPSYINGQYWEWVNLKNFDLLTPKITTLQNNIDTLNSQVVKLTGNQTIAGTKTFSVAPKVPNSTTNGTAIAQAAMSKAANGYLKLGNGIILQWGRSGSVNYDTGVTITLPTAFSNANYCVIPVCYNTSYSDNTQYHIYYQSTTQFRAFGHRVEGKSSGTRYLEWFAIGY